MTEPARVLVVVPTYNELANLESILGRLRDSVPEAHALVVDDGSPDGTGELAEKLAAADSRVHVLHRPGKAGLGPAYVAGFRWGRAHGYDVLVEMDADGSHAPEQLPRLLAALEDADLALGSRYVPGGGGADWGAIRRIVSRGGSWYARRALGLQVRDLTGGFKCFRADVLREIDLPSVRSRGYAFQVELTYRTIVRGLRVVEVPIVFRDRELGTSKMSWRITAEAAWLVPQLRRGAEHLRHPAGEPQGATSSRRIDTG